MIVIPFILLIIGLLCLMKCRISYSERSKKDARINAYSRTELIYKYAGYMILALAVILAIILEV